MLCPVCHERKARRECPARGDRICAVCCATKRLVEIACPADCVYLTSAQKHPAAAVRRRQEADVRTLAGTFGALTERQYRLGFLLLTFVGRHQPGGPARLLDTDVAEAVAALAATYETAGRGVIYEHEPASGPARGLARELKAFLEEVGRGAGASFEREAAEVLRAIERGARATASGGDRRAYVDLVARVVPSGAPGTPIGPAGDDLRIVLP